MLLLLPPGDLAYVIWVQNSLQTPKKQTLEKKVQYFLLLIDQICIFVRVYVVNSEDTIDQLFGMISTWFSPNGKLWSFSEVASGKDDDLGS